MGKLKEYADELGCRVIYISDDGSQLIKGGLYFREAKVMYVNDRLSSVKTENVILHECGHAYFEHFQYDCSYNSSFQEAQANQYMVERRFKDWLSYWDFDPEPEELSVERFMKAYEFESNLEWICEKVINEYCGYYDAV